MITFRDATEADLPAIVAMYADDVLGAQRERPEEPLPDSYRQAFEAIDTDANNRLIVAEADDGSLVATVQLTYIPCLTHQGAMRAQLESVRVHGGGRGSGIGRQLVEWSIEQARARGCTMVQLSTTASRTDAQRFYERLGFVGSHVGMKLDLS